MAREQPHPLFPRCIAFVDGQNLFYSAKEAFGRAYPDYDVKALAARICQRQNWILAEIRFYTGVPDASDNPFWNHFWTAKLAQMGRSGIVIYSRPLRYRNVVIRLPDGRAGTRLVGQEKGVDVRIALDVVRAAYEDRCDVILLMSQDQDLTEAVDEVKAIARRRGRWIRVACAYPYSPAVQNTRGIDKTDWIKIERSDYETCLDSRDYRPKQKGGS